MGSSSSRSNSSQTYSNSDQRVVADNGGFGMADGALAAGSGSTSIADTSLYKSTLNVIDNSQNYDARQFSYADNQQYHFTEIDAGTVQLASDALADAFKTVRESDATTGESFGQLIDAAETIFLRGADGLTKSQALTQDAYRQAVEVQKGSIDNKTIVILGVAGAAAVVAYVAMKK